MYNEALKQKVYVGSVCILLGSGAMKLTFLHLISTFKNCA